MKKFISTVRAAVESLLSRDEDETTENTEDTTGPVVFAENSNIQLRVRVNEQTSRVELEGPEPSLTQLSTQVKEVVLPSAGLSNSNVSTDQKTPQSTAGLSTHQSDTSSSHERPDSACATCETEETDMDRGEAEQEAMGRFIPEPMLCCEGEKDKVPPSLETLYQTAQCNSILDCLLLAAHVLLLETGFLPQGCDVRSGEMPSGWNATEGLCRLRYFYPFCENSPVQMVGMPKGQALIIKTTIKTTVEEEFSQKLALNPEDYVTKEWAGGNAGLVYRDMQKLSRVFKDKLVYPLIARAREALGLPALFGLTVLPPELLLSIMLLLDVPSLLKLSEVCRYLHSVTQDASLWKHFLYRDFRADTEHRDWKKLYKKKYQQKKAQQKCIMRRYAQISPVHLHIQDPFPHLPIPLFPPGVIRDEDYQRHALLQAILPRQHHDLIGRILDYEPPV
ncbi:F-box only protein 7-like [Tachysurus fulvidraco]|uniref:F-box only protein 7-like n=1 Tax=Tachysurus fulvidraco TaxID=1234273 RepID=UPI001FEE6EFC|nr:F-box only protein 7-like [Tachysurus fulvidraco]